MDRRILVGWALWLAPLIVLADPPPAAPAASASAASAPTLYGRARVAPAGTAQAVDGGPDAARRQRPLDLRLGDLRRYFTPAEMQSPLPDMIGDEVVVEGGRDTSQPLEAPIPVGLVAPFWAVSHPLSAWRVFVPDPNAEPRPPPDPLPPPLLR